MDQIAVRNVTANTEKFCKDSMDAKGRRSLQPKTTITFQESLQGAQVEVSAAKRVGVKQLLPQYEMDTRYIWFTPTGVDIRGQVGKYIVSEASAKALADPPIIKPYRMMTINARIARSYHETWIDACGNRLLVELWENETGPSFVQSAFSSIATRELTMHRIDPIDRALPVGKACRELLNMRADLKTYSFPLEYGDSCWLLSKFLNQWHPQVGVINGGKSEMWGTKPNNIWIPLQEFLLGKAYDSCPRILEPRCGALQEDYQLVRKSV